MAKSPTRRSWRSDTPFTKAQEIWLIQRSAYITPTQLWRAFTTKFVGWKKCKAVPDRKAFEESGGISSRHFGKEETIITAAIIARVEQYFTDDPKKHINDAAFDLDFGVMSICRILWLGLKWKPFKPFWVNKLMEKNKEDQVQFCEWILAQPEEFPQLVIWSDEKWFVLHQAPNTRNDVVWAPWHPHEEVECRHQGDSKVMAWCGVVDGRMLEVRWMVDEDGWPELVMLQRYQAMLQNQVWPEVRNRSSRWHYWFMQDGATSHTTNLNIDFLVEKFCGQLISRQSQTGHFWPTYSPNLNPLDFCVWGFIQD
jgi:hypothetical protein